jgi:hypothetical protein
VCGHIRQKSSEPLGRFRSFHDEHSRQREKATRCHGCSSLYAAADGGDALWINRRRLNHFQVIDSQAQHFVKPENWLRDLPLLRASTSSR